MCILIPEKRKLRNQHPEVKRDRDGHVHLIEGRKIQELRPFLRYRDSGIVPINILTGAAVDMENWSLRDHATMVAKVKPLTDFQSLLDEALSVEQGEVVPPPCA